MKIKVNFKLNSNLMLFVDQTISDHLKKGPKNGAFEWKALF